MDTTEKQEAARALFYEGANCAQAVLGAFADECGLTREQALLLGSSFGGGMGRLREVCGAVSGMFMVAGLKLGYSDIHSKTEKNQHYALIQELAEEFKRCTGANSIICRELLGLPPGSDSSVSESRTPEYYQKRPCAELVVIATGIIERQLAP